METESWRREGVNKDRPMEPLEPADRELAYSDPKEKNMGHFRSVLFQACLPQQCCSASFYPCPITECRYLGEPGNKGFADPTTPARPAPAEDGHAGRPLAPSCRFPSAQVTSSGPSPPPQLPGFPSSSRHGGSPSPQLNSWHSTQHLESFPSVDLPPRPPPAPRDATRPIPR